MGSRRNGRRRSNGRFREGVGDFYRDCRWRPERRARLCSGRVQFGGITEIDEGTLTEQDGELLIDVHSTTIGLTASAKDVMAMRRSITVRGGELHYTVLMAAVGQPLVHHLTATLHRQQ